MSSYLPASFSPTSNKMTFKTRNSVTTSSIVIIITVAVTAITTVNGGGDTTIRTATIATCLTPYSKTGSQGIFSTPLLIVATA